MIFYTQLLRSGIMNYDLLKKKELKEVLTTEEESKLVKYILAMYDRGLDFSPTTLKIIFF